MLAARELAEPAVAAPEAAAPELEALLSAAQPAAAEPVRVEGPARGPVARCPKDILARISPRKNFATRLSTGDSK